MDHKAQEKEKQVQKYRLAARESESELAKVKQNLNEIKEAYKQLSEKVQS